MARWPITFLVFFVAFMIPCIPFTSFWMYRRINRQWRRHLKDKRRRERRQEKAIEKRALREEEKAAKALAAQADLELDNKHESDEDEEMAQGQPANFGQNN